MDSQVEQRVSNIPILKTQASPGDPNWIDRLKEEYLGLIKYIQINKQEDNDWFKIESDREGIKWWGKCWIIHELIKYEFRLEFQIPSQYPMTPIEMVLPELDGKTSKMYRGGKICLDIHFSPLWQKNCPHFGIAHALALALGPWMAVEIPVMIEEGKIIKC